MNYANDVKRSFLVRSVVIITYFTKMKKRIGEMVFLDSPLLIKNALAVLEHRQS